MKSRSRPVLAGRTLRLARRFGVADFLPAGWRRFERDIIHGYASVDDRIVTLRFAPSPGTANSIPDPPLRRETCCAGASGSASALKIRTALVQYPNHAHFGAGYAVNDGVGIFADHQVTSPSLDALRAEKWMVLQTASSRQNPGNDSPGGHRPELRVPGIDGGNVTARANRPFKPPRTTFGHARLAAFR